MQSPASIETVNVLQAKDLKELKELLDKQVKILEVTYRKLHNDVVNLRKDMDGYHP